MAEEKIACKDEVAVRAVLLFVPVGLTTRLLGIWIPKPLAVAVSMLGWMLAIYWLPTRTDLSLRRWLIVVSVSTILSFLLAVFEPDMF